MKFEPTRISRPIVFWLANHGQRFDEQQTAQDWMLCERIELVSNGGYTVVELKTLSGFSTLAQKDIGCQRDYANSHKALDLCQTTARPECRVF